ncbi:uncharacterized protein HaLaN_09017, partial [Haematococcus lacustris]
MPVVRTSFFGYPRPGELRSFIVELYRPIWVGSGVVWDAAGHVVTNYRCISKLDKDSDELRVVLSGSNGVPLATYPARLLATDTLTDLAVLVVEAGDPEMGAAAALQPARMGTSADLVVGQSVFAIGSPAGLPRSLTAGIVSGVGRSIPSPVGTLIYGAIQTDASITVSSSGGPLLDSSGRVVGINSAAYTRTGSVLPGLLFIPAWQGTQLQLNGVEDVRLMAQLSPVSPDGPIQLSMDCLHGKVVWRVDPLRGTLTFQGLVLQHLPMGRASNMPWGSIGWGIWAVSAERCNASLQSVIVTKCTMVLPRGVISYWRYWSQQYN